MRRRSSFLPLAVEIGLVALMLAGLAWCAMPAKAGVLDRSYTVAEFRYAGEKGLAPRPYLGILNPISLGRFAVTPGVSVPFRGRFAFAPSVTVRFKFRGQ